MKKKRKGEDSVSTQKQHDTLLNLDHTPTLEELQEHFRKNDFSASTYMELDYDTMDAETVESLEYIKGFFNEKWEPLSQEMGLRSPADHYGEDNPLIAMQENMADLVAGGVLRLLEERPDRVAEILAEFMDDPDIERKADAFLHNAVETTMQVMDYPKLVQVIQELPTYEDFNHKKFGNHRAIDFKRKWGHMRSKIKTTSLDEMQDAENEGGKACAVDMADVAIDVEAQALAGIRGKQFWDSLDDSDREILELKVSGMHDYMRALRHRFYAPLKCEKLNRELEQVHGVLHSRLDRQERKLLLRIMDLENALRDEASLHSFISGYRLAHGIYRELLEEPPYSYDREEEARAILEETEVN